MIRRSKPTDCEYIIEILYENSRWLDSRGIFQWPFEWMQAQESEITHEVSIGNYHVLEECDEIIGVVHLSSNCSVLWSDKTEAVYLSKLAIKRKSTGKRKGEELMLYAEQYTKGMGIDRIRLDCISENQKLNSYYSKLGFEWIREMQTPDVELSLYEKLI